MNCKKCELNGRDIEMSLDTQDEFGPVTTERWSCPYCDHILELEVELIADNRPHFEITARAK